MGRKWKIFYDDETWLSDEMCSPFEASPRGVQAIIIEHEEVGRTIVTKENFYWWDKGRWFGGDLFGLFDYLQAPGLKKVIFGRIIETERYRNIVNLALSDPYLPPKSANLPEEKH